MASLKCLTFFMISFIENNLKYYFFSSISKLIQNLTLNKLSLSFKIVPQFSKNACKKGLKNEPEKFYFEMQTMNQLRSNCNI